MHDSSSEPPQFRPVQRWAALAGHWNFDDNSAIYAGPKEGPIAYGLAVSNVTLRDGEVRTRITLNSTDNFTAAIVIGFQSEAAPYLMGQLGAYNTAYSISELEPGFGWRAIATAGTVKNLTAHKPYEVRLRQRGQRVTMTVDDVRIFDQVLSRPLTGSQVGLFAFGANSVSFTDVLAEHSRPRVFVAMPFTEPYDTLYQHVIKPVAADAGFTVVRIDEIAGPGIILEDIQRQISDATAVIAEITSPNQNVFYELGFAHGYQKPTILLAQRGRDLPFDIRSYRVIYYDDTIGGRPGVEKNLRAHLRAILEDVAP